MAPIRELSSKLWAGRLARFRRVPVVVVHLGLWTVAFLGAFFLRFEFNIPHFYAHALWAWLLLLLATRVAGFAFYGLFAGLWRYTGTSDLLNLLKATTASSGVFAVVMALLGYRNFPRSVFIIEWLSSIIAVGGVRFAIRTLREFSAVANRARTAKRVLIVGAGNAGEMLLREMHKGHFGTYNPVAFVDDDRLKIGARIHDVSVLGPIDRLAELVERYRVEEIIIAVPSATGKQMRRLIDICKPTGITIRTLPNIAELIDGRESLTQVRSIAIEDLLRRKPVELDTDSIRRSVDHERVLVTGAGGSIGSELCAQICRFHPRQLVLVERYEGGLFAVHESLRAAFPELPISACVGDVCDPERMESIFEQHSPTVLFHAAAHKHVPLMEDNPGEAIKNNVGGTMLLADLAHRFSLRKFVMISTDKAINPRSMMGASKRAAELYVQSMSQRSDTQFVAVRFGNVLGSVGSVVPIFKEQIARGGPVRVTHPEMRRYFMTIPEACQLVLQAAALAEGGETFMLEMGEPVRIVDLARDLISLSGFVPGEDIEIVFTGVRPGEKLFEEIRADCEREAKTRHDKIFVAASSPHPWEAVRAWAERLCAVAETQDRHRITEVLHVLIPEFQPENAPPRTVVAAAVQETIVLQ